MIEIRIHGRGGQGSVVASKIFAEALFLEGKYVQAFPEFGTERRGAPVQAFVRCGETPILVRSNIYEPDHVIVLDASLIEMVNVVSGLKRSGFILINSDLGSGNYNFPEYRVALVDATKIAVRHKLGTPTTPIVNTVILGAFAKITNLVSFTSLEKAVRDYAPVKIDENVAAAKETYENVKI
ncbi:MAG: 2-oxoacid:acceptor oxidoreductase family protein [Elusimicrobia bacterium]|nr:2-oxoacid:acceptor oxidoreductase family protein [Elusimicrobiota bacterium]